MTLFPTREEIAVRREVRGLDPAPTRCDTCGGNRTEGPLDITDTRVECRLCLHERLQGSQPDPDFAAERDYRGRQAHDTDAEFEHGYRTQHRAPAR